MVNTEQRYQKIQKKKPTRQTRQPLTLSIVLPILDTEPWRSLWAFPTLMFVAFALSIKSDIVALTASEAVSSCGSAMEWKNKSYLSTKRPLFIIEVVHNYI